MAEEGIWLVAFWGLLTKSLPRFAFSSAPLILAELDLNFELNLASLRLSSAQTCQLSRFCRESHEFLSFLTVSPQGSQSHGFGGKIILK